MLVAIAQKLESQIIRTIIPNSAKALPTFTLITLGLSLVLLNIFYLALAKNKGKLNENLNKI